MNEQPSQLKLLAVIRADLSPCWGRRTLLYCVHWMDFKDNLVTCSSLAASGSGVAQNNLDDASARRS
jgi:hypothetical protein